MPTRSRAQVALFASFTLFASLAVAAPTANAAPKDRGSGLEVFVGELTPAQLDSLAAEGLDREDVATGRLRNGKVRVEAVMDERRGRKLQDRGFDLTVKRVNGKKASTALAQEAAAGYEVFRSYSEPGGIRDELVDTARRHPKIAKLVSIGRSVNGQEILALKVTKNARALKDGKRPAVLYNSAQHAREWITPEMTRRLMHHFLDGYGSDAKLTHIVNTTELWFLPVSNPDGYDYTFTEGHRLWRKNLADNDADGTITNADGVDPNRNYPTKWGYDNEGSSPEPSSQTYRGPSPASEPETRALDGLMRRIGFAYQVNYHSAAELLLYGTGWQVSTPTPDDEIYETLAGTDDNSAIPGYDPDISAELYTTNGETTEHVHETYGTLAYTPEMSTCETISNKYPDDEWEAADCISGFNFPADEKLVQEEFLKNIPFALSLATSAQDPDDPVSSVGLKVREFVTDPFTVSHGSPQPVAVTARRDLRNLRLNYSVDGGRTQRAKVSEWNGGERYGDEGDTYYAEYRGTVRGAGRGDGVKVWFSGVRPGKGRVTSERFTYTVADDIGGDVLVLAAEDVTGASPTQSGTAGHYADDYVAALDAAGYSADVYDVDVNGRTAPHHLGVLSHYDAVVWETGDDVVPREQGQPGGTAAELALDMELTVRDYLNEGGKLLYTGKFASFASAADGVYYYNPFEEEQGECTVRSYPCIPLLNDFLQYYLGAYEYVSDGGSDADLNPFPVSGDEGAFAGFSGTFNGGDSADNQDHTASLLTTSSFLPPDEFPLFSSSAPIEWDRPGAAPYDPFTGEWYLSSQRADVSYKRLTRTVDLTGATSGNLSFQTSFSTEENWDYLFVEAHTVGQDDWTTLPEANGQTTQEPGDSCAEGWNTLHPFLDHYQGPNCEPTGTTGEWNAASGTSGGWTQWDVDLSAYAGQQVEVSITYASDWGTQGLGVFLDDVTVSADGSQVAQTSFESDLGGWTVTGPPEGSAANSNDWERSQSAFTEGAGVTTEDTVYTGFGAEGLTTQAMREEFVARSMAHLLGG